MQFFVASIIILIFIIYMLMFNHPEKHINLDKIKFKTGDLILFHALDNINPLKICSYYTHIGIVIFDKSNGDNKQKPKLFEILNTANISGPVTKSGVMISDLETRIHKYKGYCFYKPINRNLSPEMLAATAEFVKYAEKNFEYDYDYRSYFFGMPVNSPDRIMNCGELVYLWMIKTGLLKPEEFEKWRYHLRFVCSVTDLESGYSYDEPSLIKYHTFSM